MNDIPTSQSRATPESPDELLRQRAEARVVTALRTPPENVDPKELQHLIHELSVHQAELEMQNEELMRAHQALEVSRARYVELHENAPVGFVTCDFSGVIVECNRTFGLMLGWSPDTLLSRRLSDLVAPVDQPRLAAAFGNLIAERPVEPLALQLNRADDTPLRVHANLTVAAFALGARPTCRIALTDIGERLEMEHRLRRLAAIVDSSDDAIVSRNLDGRITSWNVGAERLLGYSAQEMLDSTVERLLPAHRSEPSLRRLLRQAIAVPHFDTELVAKDGTVLNVSVSVSPVRDPSGATFGTAMIARDISGRISAEQALRRRVRQLELLSRTGQSLVMNPGVLPPEALQEIFRGVAPAIGAEMYMHFRCGPTEDAFELVSCAGVVDEDRDRIVSALPGNTLCDLVAARHAPLIVENLQQSDLPAAAPWRAAGARAYVGHPLLAADRLLGVVAFATRERDRFIEGDLHVLQTVCDQVSATLERTRLFEEIHANEQALRDADRKKDHFIATLAHELRNPLAPINNAVAMLRKIGNPSIAETAILETMARQVSYMVRLVDDLLEVSRITLGKITLRLERVDLMSVVRNAIDISRPLVEAGSHQLIVESPSEPLYVQADAVRLAQVFANLLNNSAKYTENGGQIRFTVKKETDSAVVAVRDTGTGISPELLPHVFELFMQGSSSRYAQSGLGIGLTLVRALVEMHGGRIDAASAGAGQGSEFTVRLPLAPAVAESQHHDGAAPVELTAACRVLLVDDNRDAANSLGGLLEILGATVDILYDGFSVVKALERFHPNVVILDIGMPGMDGYEVARTIRDHPEFSDIMLIALTGWGTAEDQRRSRRAGFDHHLVKPADINVLHHLLADACRVGSEHAPPADDRRGTYRP